MTKQLVFKNTVAVASLPTPTLALRGVFATLESDGKPYWCTGASWEDLTKGQIASISVLGPLESTGGANPTISLLLATHTADGAMSKADKAKLDSIEPGADAYELPVSTDAVLGGVRISTGLAVDSSGITTVVYGSTAGTAVQGNDARVTADQAANVASIRTLGSGALQAAAGNHSHAGVYQPVNDDLTAIAGLSSVAPGTPGIPRFDGMGGWTLDYNQYLTQNETINFAGDLTGGGEGAVLTVYLTPNGVDSGTFGNNITIPVIEVDNTGRVKTASQVLIRTASTTQTGIVQLNNTVNSTSTTQAATANAVKTAYDLAAAALPAIQKGQANGVVPLDSNGLIDQQYLPSYVDDVIEVANQASLPGTGESGKIYVALDTGNIYRWSGSAYIRINNAVSTSDTATKLTTARNINGTAFDGTANITTASWGTSRNLSLTGDATATITTDGSANASAALTLANSGVTAGSYGSTTKTLQATVDAKGRLTALTAVDIAFPAVTSAVVTGALGYTPLSATSGGAIGGAITVAGVVESTLGGFKFPDGSTQTSASSSVGNTTSFTQGTLTSSTLAATATTANQVIDQVAVGTFKTLQYLVQAVTSAGVESTHLLVVHDGTNVFITEYGNVSTTGASFGTYDAVIETGNVKLVVTPASANTTFKAIRTGIFV